MLLEEGIINNTLTAFFVFGGAPEFGRSNQYPGIKILLDTSLHVTDSTQASP